MEIKNYDDLDAQLKRLAELEVSIAAINGEMTTKINTIKEKAVKEAEPYVIEKEAIEKFITSFCEARKSDFADKRSKQFNFGEVGYKVSTTVSIPKDKAKLESLIKTIKALKLHECIAYEEKIDRERVAELDDMTFAKLGIKRTIKDNFRIVPYLEKVQE